MKLPSPYVCDECGTQKKESNHWWLVVPLSMLSATVRDYDARVFIIAVWSPALAESQGVAHLCSESCATKALSKWMASLQSPRSDDPICRICKEPRSKHPEMTGGSYENTPTHYFQNTNDEPMLWASLQSVNAGKPQPANDSSEERQNIEETVKPIIDGSILA
jgi:hypothetical protein